MQLRGFQLKIVGGTEIQRDGSTMGAIQDVDTKYGVYLFEPRSRQKNQGKNQRPRKKVVEKNGV